MKHPGYRPRIIDGKVEEYLSVFGAVCIEGPKWCGKTWTSSYHCKSAVYIGDPAGNFQNRKLAEVSPALVLEGEPPRLIDEWQEVPSLWDAVRHKVDATPEKGRFILTGSATPNHKGILHSGAGRIARLRMRPMSLYESGDSSGEVSLKKLCDGELTPVATGEVDLQKLIDLIVRGGWPGSLGLAPAYAIAEDAFRAYKNTRENRESESVREPGAKPTASSGVDTRGKCVSVHHSVPDSLKFRGFPRKRDRPGDAFR